jgi:hypothetical protein
LGDALIATESGSGHRLDERADDVGEAAVDWR